MNVTNDLMTKVSPATQREKLTAQAQKWVSQTFFGTMLKQMRNNPFKSDLFSGGRGGQVFGEMFDQQLAERMARGSGSKLVNSIVRKLERNADSYQSTSAAQQGPRPELPSTKHDFSNVRIHVSPDL